MRPTNVWRELELTVPGVARPDAAAVSVSLLCFCCFDSLLTQLYFSFVNRGSGGCATTTTTPSSSIVLLLLLIIVLRLLVLFVLLVILLLVLLVLLLLTGKNEYVMYPTS